MPLRSARALAALALVTAAPAVRAEVTFVAEVPAALAVSEPQRSAFRLGAMPAAGVYRGGRHLTLGLRLRAGVLRDGPAPGDGLADPGVGGLVTGSVAVRGHLRGGWTELALGRGFTGGDAAPTIELGVGYALRVGGYELGPSARYLRVIAGDDPMHTLGSVDVVLLGLDLRWGGRPAVRRAAPRPAPPPVAPRRVPATPPDVIGPVEPVADVVIDLDESCARVPEGCPGRAALVVEGARLVLDDRVLFDLDRARVRRSGREVARTIVALWGVHPEWARIRIEGHTDARGDAAYNLELSQRRADRVKEVLVREGADPARIDAVGLGATQLRDPGTTDAAHRRNRRVEFVILREVP